MRIQPRAWVVDASVAVKLIHPEPLAERAEALLGQIDAPSSTAGFVPDLFFVECANVIWRHARRLGETPTTAARDLMRLRNLPLTSVSTYELVEDALQIALSHRSTAYDACYVALAARLGIPLITADEALVRRFTSTSYEVVWLGDRSLALM